MDPSENPYASAQYDSQYTHAKVPVDKPVSAIVFGILHLFFGIPGLLCSPVNLYMIDMINNPNRPPNPAWDVMRDTPGYMGFYMASIVLGMVMSVVLITAGIGLLQGRPWGRSVSVGYCWATIALSVVGAVVNFLFLYEPLSQIQGPEGTGAMIGFVFGMVAGPIYPIITLIFMYRPNFVEYFRQN